MTEIVHWLGEHWETILGGFLAVAIVHGLEDWRVKRNARRDRRAAEEFLAGVLAERKAMGLPTDRVFMELHQINCRTLYGQKCTCTVQRIKKP